jgi:sulfur carrier protein ThiS
MISPDLKRDVGIAFLRNLQAEAQGPPGGSCFAFAIDVGFASIGLPMLRELEYQHINVVVSQKTEMPLMQIAAKGMRLIREALSSVGVSAEVNWEPCLGEFGRNRLAGLLAQVDSNPRGHILLPTISALDVPHMITYLGLEESTETVIVANNQSFVREGWKIFHGVQRMERSTLIEAVVSEGQGVYLINLSST